MNACHLPQVTGPPSSGDYAFQALTGPTSSSQAR
jgi:hypothetical protein